MHGPLDMGFMPIKNIDDDIDWIHNTVSYGNRTTKYRLSILPRKCCSSKKNIWFKFAYRVRHSLHGSFDPYFDEDRWYDKHEYIKLKLMG
jgi:hypothetical protein